MPPQIAVSLQLGHGSELCKTLRPACLSTARAPAAGNGANMAFCDAMQLAEQLTDPGNATLAAAVAAYDAESGPRSLGPLEAGERNMAVAHQRGIRRSLVVAALWLLGCVLRARQQLMALRR